jgi:uncharacterized SAM-binding protein YcdF (DUF218 family)
MAPSLGAVPFLHPARWIRRLLLLAVAGLLAIVLIGVNLRLFVWPSTDAVQPADAVVVLAGGDGERLDHGLALVRAGVAPTLAVSIGPDQLCNSTQSFSVVCFLPNPETTRGEAEAIGRLAREHGWDNIVLVTSTSHVTRARLLLERCYSGTLQTSPATPSTDVPSWLGAIVHEWGGLAEAAVVRAC